MKHPLSACLAVFLFAGLLAPLPITAALATPTAHTFTNATANPIIHVTFVQANYYFTVNAGLGCTILPAGTGTPPVVTVPYKGSITFSIAANTGYDLVDVLKDGVSQGPVPSATFSDVDADHTIAATCARKQFTITATAGANGTFAPSGNVTVDYGSNKTFTITPNIGYVVADVVVDGVSAGPVTTYTFENVTANHTIFATFKEQTPTSTSTPTVTSTPRAILPPQHLPLIMRAPRPTDTPTPTATPTIRPTFTPTLTRPLTSTPTSRPCCKCCTPGVSKPCGDTCISASYTCHTPPGCACYCNASFSPGDSRRAGVLTAFGDGCR